MELTVQFRPSVLHYFNTLIDTLFDQGYFSYKEEAVDYVINMITSVEQQIDFKTHHHTPYPLNRYGQYFISFKMSQRTTWYFIFDRRDKKCLVTYVFNSHCEETKYLNV